MSFLIHSISNSNVVPMEYYPCGSLAVVGTPMVFYNGMLIDFYSSSLLVEGTELVKLPLYISMGVKNTTENGANTTLDDLPRIPVIRVRDDIIFEATSEKGGLVAGSKVIVKVSSTYEEGGVDKFVVESEATVAPQFEVVEAKEPNKGSTVQKVLIRYIG